MEGSGTYPPETSSQYIEAARDSWYDSVVNGASFGWFPGKGRSLYLHAFPILYVGCHGRLHRAGA
eukprot:11224111-Lingulodinium_polyedra.AAC.1